MRSVIVDSARARLAERRGGDAQKMTLSTDLAQDLAAGREAHRPGARGAAAAGTRPMRARRRWWRCATSAATATSEIAETLDVTERTVQRDWEKAKMLLRAILSPD